MCPHSTIFLVRSCTYSLVRCLDRYMQVLTDLFLLAPPPPEDVYTDMVIPNNTPVNYTFPMSKLNTTKAPGGSYKVVDTRLFPAAQTICAADVQVEVGGMRYVTFLGLIIKTLLTSSHAVSST